MNNEKKQLGIESANYALSPTNELQTTFVSDDLTRAEESLKMPAKQLSVNLCAKNWDVEEIKKFDRAVFMGIKTEYFPIQDTNEMQPLEVAYFMVENEKKTDVYYKAAYKFVKAMSRLQKFDNFSVEFLELKKISNGNKAETFNIYPFIMEKGARNE